MIDYDTPKRDFLQYILYVCFKRKWMITWGFLLLFVPFVLATKISYPIYHAITKVWVHRGTNQMVSFMPDVQMPTFNVNILPPGMNWIEVINGQNMAKEVVREFRLAEFYRQQKMHPSNFREKFWYYLKYTIYWPIDKMIQLFTWLGVMEPFEPYRDFTAYAVEKVMEDYITIVVAQQMTEVLAISCYGPTPELSEDIANFLADRLITQIVASEQGVARFAVDFAEQQLKNISVKLAKAEDALTEYRKQMGVLDIPQQKKLHVDLADNLNSQVLGLEMAQEELEAKLNTIDAQIESQKTAYVSNFVLQKNVMDQNEVVVDIAVNEESRKVLEEQFKDVDKRAVELIEAEIVSKRLEREIDIYSNLRGQFQDKVAKLQIETVSRLKAVAMEVVDPAYLPPDVEPAWPKDTANYILGILLGLVTGLAMAFMVEFFNDSLRTRTEVEQELNLPVLAAVPESPLRNKP